MFGIRVFYHRTKTILRDDHVNYLEVSLSYVYSELLLKTYDLNEPIPTVHGNYWWWLIEDLRLQFSVSRHWNLARNWFLNWWYFHLSKLTAKLLSNKLTSIDLWTVAIYAKKLKYRDAQIQTVYYKQLLLNMQSWLQKEIREVVILVVKRLNTAMRSFVIRDLFVATFVRP